MNIEHVTVEVLETPVESAYTAAGNQVSSNFHVLARIFTDDGMQGIGFDVVLRPTLVKSMAQICQELGQLRGGMNVLEIEAARAELERASGGALTTLPQFTRTTTKTMATLFQLYKITNIGPA